MTNKYYMTLTSIALAGLLLGCGDSSDGTITDSDTDTNSTESVKDITDIILSNRSGNCEDYINAYTSQVTDIQENTDFEGSLEIELSDGKCEFTSNSIPNHDFNDDTAHFATQAVEVAVNVEITSSPSFATSVTELDMNDNAIMLNGVKLNILSAGCYGVGDGNSGCDDLDEPFRYDPMGTESGFGVDMHNAHVQPTGLYHYHASPMALFDTDGNVESPVIGFASDGFPIYGNYFNDNGSVRSATSSYALKSGSREDVVYNGETYSPGGDYDGTYTSDWEYVAGSGDLDECNGMTVDGVYGYYITDTYPWVIHCYKGTPDSSFSRSGGPGGA